MTKPQNGERARKESGRSDSKSLRSRYRLLPLDLMLECMNDERLRLPLRLKIAEATLGYVHHRLATISIGGADREEQHSLDLSKLNDDELAAFERICTKAQVTIPAKPYSPFDDRGDDERKSARPLRHDDALR